MKQLSAVVAGYGMRGETYAKYAITHPEQLVIKAIADPNPVRQEKARRQYGLTDDAIYNDWRDLCDQPKLADIAIVGTQDQMHTEPALALIDKGYHLLLEKPMATTAKECKLIAEAAEKKGVKVVVCHVLRFTQFWYAIKEILDEGRIGTPLSIIHTEGVGHLHQGHSYVRGNWRNSAESSPMILAKSSHDMDILQWLLGKPCNKIQSFGDLHYFRAENRPEGATDRCQDCPHRDTCTYEPTRFYSGLKNNPWRDYVAGVTDATDEQIVEALNTSPYGRCVFACDNDVVDHQTVNMEFEGGCTAVFTMTAFTEGRTIRIFGTEGEIDADMNSNTVRVHTFNDKKTEVLELEKIGQHIDSGHGGGDAGIMVDLLKLIGGEQPSKSVCDVRVSYLNHVMAFAAEESRQNGGQTVDVAAFVQQL